MALYVILLSVTIYLHRRGAFSVARFDNPGNAKAFTLWNERQTGSTFFVCMPLLSHESACLGSAGINKSKRMCRFSSSKDYKLTIHDFGKEEYTKREGIYIHPNITDLNKPIFRYMPLEHVLSMLESQELYVPNRKSFSDASERGRKVNPKNTFPLSPVSRSRKKTKADAALVYDKWSAAYSVCISCWTYDSLSDTENNAVDENYLMWKAYGHNNICCRIETTINDLIHSIKDKNGFDILASNVTYVYEHLNDGCAQHHIFEKPIYYRDEKEFRLCVLMQEDSVRLKIDPFPMIKRITLSPFITKRYGDFLKDSIKYKYPEWDVLIDESCVMEVGK